MEKFLCSISIHKLLLLLVLIMCYAAPSLSVLVPPAPLVLDYHKGPLLTGPDAINVYVLWYGNFSSSQKATISDFLNSFGAKLAEQPSVSTWWATTRRYTDSAKQGVSMGVDIGGEASDALYSLGKNLKRSHVALLVRQALANRLFPSDAKGIYLVLTADDVYVERFCMDSCGFHESIRVSESGRILLAWVGNSAVQCPGQCAWPFAAPLYGPPTAPLVPPNGDVGVDGMVINVATVVAETVTNPFNSGYYQGSALAPQEAVTACRGIYGEGAYPGYPGELMEDKQSKASYNAYGVNKRKFLLPSMWNPWSRSCATLSSLHQKP